VTDPAAVAGPPPGGGDRPVRVVVADDNPVVLRGLVALLGTDPGIAVVGEAVDGRHAVHLARALRPDLALLDVRMPGLDGIAAARQLAGTTTVVLLTYSEEPDVVAAALAAGVRGYLVHGRFRVEELLRAVHGAPRGEAHLSPTVAGEALRHARDRLAPLSVRAAAQLTTREVEVCELMLDGRSNAEIAGALFLSDKTVKNHLTRIFAKLAARNRAEAVAVLTGRAPRTDLSPGGEHVTRRSS
jgi:DNA-binding NarL/FixJ family response regulator